MEKDFLNDIRNRINSIKDERKRKLINRIIKDDKWYLKVSLDTFMSILYDLEYSKEEAVYFFKELHSGE